jgi:polysaccharide export outer membrane protein
MMNFPRAFAASCGVLLVLMPLQSGAATPEDNSVTLAPMAPGPEPATLQDQDKPLSFGDIVSFQIMEDKDLPVRQRVTDTGELDVPYIGRVNVAGKTCSEAAAIIKRQLESEYYYKATVRLGIDQVNRAANIGRVYVSGLVRLPGPQVYNKTERMTASAAIIKAGGFAEFADQKKVRVTRKDKEGSTQTFMVNMKAVLEQGKVDADVELKENDYIFVPRRLINY